MNTKVILVHKYRKIPNPIDVSISQPYEDIVKHVLDTREMKFEIMKMFNLIKYGGIMTINKVGLTYKIKTPSKEKGAHVRFILQPPTQTQD